MQFLRFWVQKSELVHDLALWLVNGLNSLFANECILYPGEFCSLSPLPSSFLSDSLLFMSPSIRAYVSQVPPFWRCTTRGRWRMLPVSTTVLTPPLLSIFPILIWKSAWRDELISHFKWWLWMTPLFQSTNSTSLNIYLLPLLMALDPVWNGSF